MIPVFPLPKFYVRFGEPYDLDGIKFRSGEVATIDFQVARLDHAQAPGFVVFVRTLGRKKARERCLTLPRFDDLFAAGIVRALERREYDANRYAERGQGIIVL